MSDDLNSRITLERDGHLAILTMVSEPLNLFDREMIAAWKGRLDQLHAEPPRALLIRAKGRAVSGGVDVKIFQGLDSTTGGELWRELFEDISQRIEKLPCPVLFSAHALTLTAAFEISLASDLLIASSNAKFGLVEKVVALTPSMGGPQRLADRAGSARARELVMTAGLYDAATLKTWGVVNWVVEPEELESETLRIAHDLADGPTKAHHATKQLVKAWSDGGVLASDEAVVEVAGALFDTDDNKRAIETFLEKGPGHATYNGY